MTAGLAGWTARLTPLALLGVLAAGCQNASPPSAAATAAHAASTLSAQPAQSTESASSFEALKVLETLTVGGRGPKTGYSRARFGRAWADVDHNGCDTRDDILNRDLSAKTWRSGTHDCVVLSGRFTEPYTGKAVTFSKSRASAIQIDHVVALSDAWQKGAAQWPAAERLSLRERPAGVARGGRTNQRIQRRRGRRHLAAAEHLLPLRLRGQADRCQSQIPVEGHPG